MFTCLSRNRTNCILDNEVGSICTTGKIMFYQLNNEFHFILLLNAGYQGQRRVGFQSFPPGVQVDQLRNMHIFLMKNENSSCNNNHFKLEANHEFYILRPNQDQDEL